MLRYQLGEREDLLKQVKERDEEIGRLKATLAEKTDNFFLMKESVYQDEIGRLNNSVEELRSELHYANGQVGRLEAHTQRESSFVGNCCIVCGVDSDSNKPIGDMKSVQIYELKTIVADSANSMMCENCQSLSVEGLDIGYIVESERRRPCLKSMLDTFSRANYFSVYRIADDECKYLCGLSKDNLQSLPGDRHDVFMFHFICRQNLTQRLAASLTNSDQPAISNMFNSVLPSLSQYLCPKYLRYEMLLLALSVIT
jgi:hypothetical protein